MLGDNSPTYDGCDLRLRLMRDRDKEDAMNKRVRKAVFPAGGLGTRFLPATKSIPKEMLALVTSPSSSMASRRRLRRNRAHHLSQGAARARWRIISTIASNGCNARAARQRGVTGSFRACLLWRASVMCDRRIRWGLVMRAVCERPGGRRTVRRYSADDVIMSKCPA